MAKKKSEGGDKCPLDQAMSKMMPKAQMGKMGKAKGKRARRKK